MMDQFFRTQPHMGKVSSINDLVNLKLHNDQGLADFRFLWDHIVENKPEKLDDKTLEDMLAEKLEASVVLKEDLSHYHRIKLDHEDRSYAYLRGTIDRYLNRKQQEKNRSDNRQMVVSKAFQPLKLAAPAAGKGEKGKGNASAPKAESKAKSKAKGKGTDAKIPTDEAGVPYCRFFHLNPNGCSRGKDCFFSHQTPKKAVLDVLSSLPRTRSASPKKGGKGDGKGTAKAGGKGKKDSGQAQDGATTPRKLYCIKFQKGECTFGDRCRFDHEIKPAEPKAPQSASPKAASKGKGKAAPAAAPQPEEQ